MENTLKLLTGFNCVSVAFRILLAAAMGGGVGFERSHHRQAAGLRTHMLVCLGATLSSLIGLYTTEVLGYGGDPMRIGAQVISGIGFLGAGTIMTRSSSQVSGLTTAAGLWTTASIGLALGVGFYLGAGMVFVGVMIVIGILSKSGRLQRVKMNSVEYYIEFVSIDCIEPFLEQIAPQHLEVRVLPPRSDIPGHMGLQMTVTGEQTALSSFLQEIRGIEGVALAIPTSKWQ